jgi:hypothetical protein
METGTAEKAPLPPKIQAITDMFFLKWGQNICHHSLIKKKCLDKTKFRKKKSHKGLLSRYYKTQTLRAMATQSLASALMTSTRMEGRGTCG